MMRLVSVNPSDVSLVPDANSLFEPILCIGMRLRLRQFPRGMANIHRLAVIDDEVVAEVVKSDIEGHLDARLACEFGGFVQVPLSEFANVGIEVVFQ